LRTGRQQGRDRLRGAARDQVALADRVTERHGEQPATIDQLGNELRLPWCALVDPSGPPVLTDGHRDATGKAEQVATHLVRVAAGGPGAASRAGGCTRR